MLKHLGINYDTGINYEPGVLSRLEWDPAVGASDMRVIAEELHCTSVNILGADLDRLDSCARSAAEAGLEVWLQPRLIDHSQVDVLDHLSETATLAERIATDGAAVYLHLGCELTIFLPGIVPGDSYVERMQRLNARWLPPLGCTRRLNAYLARARERARKSFSGPITYAAGDWERVDWSGFDLRGVNRYRDDANRGRYESTVRRLTASRKPVIITEFGTCSYRAADSAGGVGHDVIDYRTDPPTIDPDLLRDEYAQADHLAELIELYRNTGVEGCFVYAFSEPTNTYSTDPARDLDKASYGIVSTLPDDPTGGTWQPKQAFSRVAKAYLSGGVWYQE